MPNKWSWLGLDAGTQHHALSLGVTSPASLYARGQKDLALPQECLIAPGRSPSHKNPKVHLTKPQESQEDQDYYSASNNPFDLITWVGHGVASI